MGVISLTHPPPLSPLPSLKPLWEGCSKPSLWSIFKWAMRLLPALPLRTALWSPPMVTSTKTFKIKINSALTTWALEFNRCLGRSCYRICDYVLGYTHTFSQTCTHTGTQVHIFKQPVSEITEWEKESLLDWVLYLGISDLFTLMSVGTKVKKTNQPDSSCMCSVNKTYY